MRDKDPRINLVVKESDNERWLKVSKKIKQSNINIQYVVGAFLLDELEKAEKSGFDNLKKYI